MASAEVMTACENVCGDFGWLFDWLKEIAGNPVWALFLGGLISLAIWRMQTKLAFELELKREKRELYRNFIRQIGKAARVKHEADADGWDLNPEVRKLWALQKEIVLVGSIASSETSQAVLAALETLFEEVSPRVTSLDGLERSLDENVLFASDRMVDAMRREIGTNF